jgi:hypothetical protein
MPRTHLWVIATCVHNSTYLFYKCPYIAGLLRFSRPHLSLLCQAAFLSVAVTINASKSPTMVQTAGRPPRKLPMVTCSM